MDALEPIRKKGLSYMIDIKRTVINIFI